MQVLLWILSIAFLVVIKPWWISWFVTAAVLVVVVAGRICNASISKAFARKPRPEIDEDMHEGEDDDDIHVT